MSHEDPRVQALAAHLGRNGYSDSASSAAAAASTVKGQTAGHAKPFHPHRLVRQVDVLRRRKLAKVRWLQQLYGVKQEEVDKGHVGESRDVSDDGHASRDDPMMQMGLGDHPFALPNDGGEGPAEARELASTLGHRVLAHSKPEDALDGEFWAEIDAAVQQDDMVEWAQALDYEGYAATWALLGTTRPAAEPAGYR